MESKNISLLPHEECNGCRLCGDVCPKMCISFVTDAEGFYYPTIKEDQCINCGLCVSKCSSINLSHDNLSDDVLSACASDKGIHEIGSSGSVFYQLASSVLKKGGWVFGAMFDENHRLFHKGIDKESQLAPLCKSKYLQSDCGGAYKQVVDKLKEGLDVLFCGTPCQCQALKNLVGSRLNEKLLLVDFACHGVSCQKLFDQNLDYYEKKGGLVKKYTFREKKNANYHHYFSVVIQEKDSNVHIKRGTYYKDPYYYGYEKRFTLRPSCYRCKWANKSRCSDLTLSDFFGIEELDPTLSKKYVSGVFRNTPKGVASFNEIKENMIGVKSYPIEFAVKKNECLSKPVALPALRESFFKEWIKYGYEYIRMKYLSPKHKWIYDLYYCIPQNARSIVRRKLKR